MILGCALQRFLHPEIIKPSQRLSFTLLVVCIMMPFVTYSLQRKDNISSVGGGEAQFSFSLIGSS